MAPKSDYVTGTITLTNGSANFTGAGTGWLLAGFLEGDTIIDVTGATEFMGVIASIDANGAGTLTKPWEGPTVTSAYRMRYQPDGTRQTAQARQLIELLGDGTLQSLAGLTGPGVIELTIGGGAQVVPKTDLISGAAYDVQVADIAARAAYDAQAAGYAVLVANTGDGRSAIYSKVSNASGDWTVPAYVTGPVGPIAAVTVGTTTTGAPGSAAVVTPTPNAGGVKLDFTIPAGRGATPKGTYSPATTYVLDDAVLDNGSTWIALGPTTGNAPPVLPATSNAYWQLLARKGTDGSGTGDVVGPASSGADRIAVFSGTTGKLLKDGGRTVADLLALIPPPTDLSDLETTVSMLALQVADNSNVALFLGPTGNRVADSFDTLTYVDVAGATNLDTSAAGVLKPTISSTSQIPQATGIAFGNMTGGGGLAAAFDGTTGQSFSTSANRTGVPAYVGKNYSASRKRIHSARFYATSDAGFDATAAATNYTLQLYAKLGAAPASSTDGTLLGSATGVDANGIMVTVSSSDVGTAWDYVWGVVNTTEASNFQRGLAELEFFEPGVASNMTVRSTVFTAAAVPTKMKALFRVKEVAAATAGTDYTLECSRDGGTTWALMPLTEMFVTGGLLYVEGGETSVSGQPSGTVPRWRFKTLNSKNVELHDVYLYWT